MSSSTTEYLKKDAAAKLTGLSARRLLELAHQGRVRKKYALDKVTHRRVATFAIEDLNRIKNGDSPQTWGAQVSAPVNAGRLLPPTNVGGTDLIAHSGQDVVVVEAKSAQRWLTFEAAAQFSGLPESFLLQLVVAGKLPALDVGVRPGGRYRVSRRDLDAIEGERMAPADRLSAAPGS